MRNLLRFILFFMIATVLMGVGVTAVLASPAPTLQNILSAAGAGFILAVPITWAVVAQITRNVPR